MCDAYSMHTTEEQTYRYGFYICAHLYNQLFCSFSRSMQCVCVCILNVCCQNFDSISCQSICVCVCVFNSCLEQQKSVVVFIWYSDIKLCVWCNSGPSPELSAQYHCIESPKFVNLKNYIRMNKDRAMMLMLTLTKISLYTCLSLSHSFCFSPIRFLSISVRIGLCVCVHSF